MKDGWGVTIQGCKLFQVVRKLKLLKRSLKKLNLQFNGIIKRVDQDREM